ncbi:carbon-nitrogen hydrolase family protein [Streptomyces rubradiris]|uniref:Hydrolase n=1 Tax=Streptomyces rubradiris TaxID=285531 RepID=A0ABQ3RDF5_STRRR|nr:carbon-nitrogen hydrolase family protein [Streptomyces rubradiris]GHG95521.1 hydrolase [Streptomyces rubradiris]GHI53901.1 hydrolase [Streptomyces rubradiris]
MSTASATGKLRVALLQSLGVPSDVGRTLKRLEGAAGEAAAAGADLLVTPELFLGGYVNDVRSCAAEIASGGSSAGRVNEIAAGNKIAVAIGYPELDETGKKRPDGDPVVYNSVRLIDSTGSSLANYRKTHLFGDFEKNHFEAGTNLVVQADLNGLKLGFLICYDVEFPETVRAHAIADTDLLVAPTATMDPYAFSLDHLVLTRAYENNMYIAYANRIGKEHPNEGELEYVGRSTLAAPDGTALARAGRGGRDKVSSGRSEELVFGDYDELIFGTVDRNFLKASRGNNPYRRERNPKLYGALSADDPNKDRL